MAKLWNGWRLFVLTTCALGQLSLLKFPVLGFGVLLLFWWWWWWFFFLSKSYSVTLAGLKLSTILLPQPPKYQSYSCELYGLTLCKMAHFSILRPAEQSSPLTLHTWILVSVTLLYSPVTPPMATNGLTTLFQPTFPSIKWWPCVSQSPLSLCD